MTRLLVSVRNAAEAQVALAGGVDVIDLKEPAHGALGRPDDATLSAVLATVALRRPFSMALGELLDLPLPVRLPGGVQYAKIGLAGCAVHPTWRLQWREALGTLPAATLRVAVAYADYHSARAPAPDDVIAAGAAFGCGVALVDTFHKDGSGLLDYWTWPQVAEFVNQVRQAKMLVALAGSLTLAHVERLLSLVPDFIAVRGAACRGGRTGALDAAAVAALVNAVAAHRSRPASGSIRQPS